MREKSWLARYAVTPTRNAPRGRVDGVRRAGQGAVRLPEVSLSTGVTAVPATRVVKSSVAMDSAGIVGPRVRLIKMSPADADPEAARAKATPTSRPCAIPSRLAFGWPTGALPAEADRSALPHTSSIEARSSSSPAPPVSPEAADTADGAPGAGMNSAGESGGTTCAGSTSRPSGRRPSRCAPRASTSSPSRAKYLSRAPRLRAWKRSSSSSNSASRPARSQQTIVRWRGRVALVPAAATVTPASASAPWRPGEAPLGGHVAPTTGTPRRWPSLDQRSGPHPKTGSSREQPVRTGQRHHR